MSTTSSPAGRAAGEDGPLAGRRALVTGATSGIGRAVARALAAGGAAVAVAGRDPDRLAQVQQELVGTASRVVAVPLDVTDDAGVRRGVAHAATALDGLDLLVCSAGVMLLGPVEQADVEDWRQMLDTNVLGLMAVTRAALPHLLAEGGDVVHLSSTAGRAARPGGSGYHASKWAVTAFSEALRQEVAERDVRVTLVEPGMVDTPMTTDVAHPATRLAVQPWLDGPAPLRPEDVAAAVVWAVAQPARVSIGSIVLRPAGQVR